MRFNYCYILCLVLKCNAQACDLTVLLQLSTGLTFPQSLTIHLPDETFLNYKLFVWTVIWRLLRCNILFQRIYLFILNKWGFTLPGRPWLPPLQAKSSLLAIKVMSLNDDNFHRPVLNDCDCKHLFWCETSKSVKFATCLGHAARVGHVGSVSRCMLTTPLLVCFRNGQEAPRSDYLPR